MAINDIERYRLIVNKFYKYVELNRLRTDNVYLQLHENELIFNVEEEFLSIINSSCFSKEITIKDIKLFLTDYPENLGKLYEKFIFVEKQLSFNEVLYCYIHTIDKLSDKYSGKIILKLIKILSKVFTHIFKCYSIIGIENIEELSYFILLKKENIQIDKDIYLNIGNKLFTPIFLALNHNISNFKRKEKFIEYINFVGINNYKLFLEYLYSFIIKEFHKGPNAHERMYILFIFHNLYGCLMDMNKIEQCLKLFISEERYSEEGLTLLRKVNSSYAEEYQSFLLMKELVENE